MEQVIEKPKVFISYAWASEEYQNKVLAFATELLSVGIDVILDKWNLTEGNDTYAFMEKCVADETITNVLILLDPVYAKKADEHTGGVGTETQIISAKVYHSVTQDKFIPIIMERDEQGNVCKPIYLQGRLHFDLSIDEKYDIEYRRLILKLFGKSAYPKPQLGTKPSWVDAPPALTSTKVISSFDTLKENQPEKIKHHQLTHFLEEIKNKILIYGNDVVFNNIPGAQYVGLYEGMLGIRDEYLSLFQYVYYVSDYIELISDFLEDLRNSLEENGVSFRELKRTFLHELFIYSVSLLLKNKEYCEVGSLLCRTFYSSAYRNEIRDFRYFYAGDCDHELDMAVNNVDQKKYYSGTAALWIKNINTLFCSKEQFVYGDMFCFNYSIFGKAKDERWYWFPLTYVYDNEYHSCVRELALKLSSKHQLERILPAFGFTAVQEFVDNYVKVCNAPQQEFGKYRFSQAFEVAANLSFFIKPDQIAEFN